MLIDQGICYLAPGSYTVLFSDDILEEVSSGYLFIVRGDSVGYAISSVDEENKTIYLSSKYMNNRYVDTNNNESIDTGDGGSSYSFELSDSPVIPLSVVITDESETEEFTDDGSGNLVGSGGGTGTINYLTGSGTITFAGVVESGDDILCSYNYGVQMNGFHYSIITGYTNNFSLPEPTLYDLSAITVIREALRILDSSMSKLFRGDPVEHTDDYTLTYADLGRTHRMDASVNKTFTLLDSSDLTANDDGVMVKFIKMQSSGNLTIAAGSDTDIMGESTLVLTEINSSAFLEYSYSNKRWYKY